MNAFEAFNVRDQSITCRFQNDLLSRGKIGQIAFGLFRAQKRSTLAKTYRRGMRHKSYDAKNEALHYLDTCLTLWADELGYRWGWQHDSQQEFHNQVLYFEDGVFGQASFHAQRASSNKRFEGKWDRRKASADVIIAFCDHVIKTVPESLPLSDDAVFPFGKHNGKQLRDIPVSYFEWLGSWEGLREWSVIRDYIATRCGSKAVMA